MPPGSDRPAQLGVQRLDGVGGINDPPDRLGEGKERNHEIPVAARAQSNSRVFFAPRTGFELIQRSLARPCIDRPVNRF